MIEIKFTQFKHNLEIKILELKIVENCNPFKKKNIYIDIATKKDKNIIKITYYFPFFL